MPKFKLLVAGDSFANLDPKHSHWARIWTQKNGGTTEHLAISGGDMTSITSHVLSSVTDWDEYAGLLYFKTDPFRIEAIDASKHSGDMLHPIDIMNTFHYNAREIDEDDLPNDFVYWLYSGKYDNDYIWTQRLKTVHTMGTEMLEFKPARHLYTNISLRWLLRANFNSMKLLMQTAKAHGLPICVVNSAWRSDSIQVQSLIPEIDYIWTMHSDVDAANYASSSSLNHVEIDLAISTAKAFESEVIQPGAFALR